MFFCKFYNDHVDTRFTFTDELETSCGGVTEQKHFYIFTLGVFLGQIIYRSGMQMLYAQMVCSCAFSLQLIQSCRLWFILQLLCVFSFFLFLNQTCLDLGARLSSSMLATDSSYDSVMCGETLGCKWLSLCSTVFHLAVMSNNPAQTFQPLRVT